MTPELGHTQMSIDAIWQFMLMGGIVVYGTLFLLAILGSMGGVLFTALEKRFGDVDDPEARRLERERRAEELAEQERVRVVICAAVAEVVGEKHRVINFKPAGETNWTMQGRTQLHASHKLR